MLEHLLDQHLSIDLNFSESPKDSTAFQHLNSISIMALRVGSPPISRSLSDISQTLSAKSAAALDQELMSTGAFSIDQLMELAGLSVSQACKIPPHSSLELRSL